RAAGGQRGGLEPLPKPQPQCTVPETSGHNPGGSRRRTIRDRADERDLVVRTPAAGQGDTHVPFGLVRSRERAKRLYLLRSEEHTSELQSRGHLVCRLLLEKKKKD